MSRASVYTTYMGKVRSTFSDQQGRVVVDFAFDNLTVSHINYQKESVKVLPDTLFMVQSTQLLSEVVVSPVGEPAWVRPMLMGFVKTKARKYRNVGVQRYAYQTQNVGDTVLYRFASNGLVRKNEYFEISPLENVITFKDKSAGCDYGNLKNTLYHDFVSDMDEKFVKEHKFYVDNESEDLGANVVRILFKSKKDWKDSGYLCIDTLQNAILRAKRSTGLAYNVQHRTNALVRSTINAMYGHKYKDWQIDIEAVYQQADNYFYLSSCRYSNYIQEVFDGKKKRVEVYNVTSIYEAQPCQKDMVGEDAVFLLLPRPFAMKIIVSKKESRQEELLQNVKKAYHIY
ncbi:MAG: hypothetical protein ACTTJJ_06835 [Prevotella fusca]|uniref:hypothetical protein n=1 Tax=Prevotella fusca TaxID=589436 RepID=UPI003F9F4340